MLMKTQIIVIDQHPIGDSRIERHISYMEKHGYKIFRIHIDRKLNVKSSGLIEYKIPCYNMGSAIGKNTKVNCIVHNIHSFIGQFGHTKQVLSILRIDPEGNTIVHVHDPTLLPYAAKICRSLVNSKMVYDRHEIYETRSPWIPHVYLPRVGRFTEIMTQNEIAGVITVSEAYCNSVKNLFPNTEVTAVPNYPSFEDYDEETIRSKIEEFSENTCLRFIYIGSLGWNNDRDLRLILKVFDFLIENKQNVQFIIGGRTDDEKLLLEFTIRQKDYPDRFTYTGYIPHQQVIELTQTAHFGFFMIRPETHYWVLASPNKVFEYLKCGVIPILRANCLCREQLQSCSLWFERYDDEQMICDEILKIVNNRRVVYCMMSLSHIISKEFSYDYVAKNYETLYESIK